MSNQWIGVPDSNENVRFPKLGEEILILLLNPFEDEDAILDGVYDAEGFFTRKVVGKEVDWVKVPKGWKVIGWAPRPLTEEERQ